MSLKEGAAIVLEQCLAVKSGEQILIITDDNKIKIGKALYEVAKEISNNSAMIVIKPQKVSGTEPPIPVAAAMKEANVVICPTTASLTHTNARLEAVKAGTRIATMPGITEKMFSEGPIRADYDQVALLTDKITNMLSKAQTVRIITGKNYELTLSLEGRNGVASKGVYRNPGESGNLPSGEGYIAPVEGKGNGKYYVDGSIVGVGRLKRPVLLSIEDGRIIGFEGKDCREVESAFPEVEEARMIGELGIGTNPEARITGVILEDEKIYGSIHLAFGTNITFGGKLKTVSHIDCVTLKPTLYLDDNLLIEKGQIKEEVFKANLPMIKRG
jgi:leucyl aminopeptidase (aminopeptidase T)